MVSSKAGKSERKRKGSQGAHAHVNKAAKLPPPVDPVPEVRVAKVVSMGQPAVTREEFIELLEGEIKQLGQFCFVEEADEQRPSDANKIANRALSSDFSDDALRQRHARRRIELMRLLHGVNKNPRFDPHACSCGDVIPAIRVQQFLRQCVNCAEQNERLLTRHAS